MNCWHLTPHHVKTFENNLLLKRESSKSVLDVKDEKKASSSLNLRSQSEAHQPGARALVKALSSWYIDHTVERASGSRRKKKKNCNAASVVAH